MDYIPSFISLILFYVGRGTLFGYFYNRFSISCRILIIQESLRYTIFNKTKYFQIDFFIVFFFELSLISEKIKYWWIWMNPTFKVFLRFKNLFAELSSELVFFILKFPYGFHENRGRERERKKPKSGVLVGDPDFLFTIRG